MTQRLFVHHPMFRLISPLFGGTLVYLLILLINNSIAVLQETFLSQELYVCIGLAYITQEGSRLSLLLFQSLDRPKSFLLKMVLQLISSIVLTIVLVSIAMYFYFRYILLYTPNSRELFVFNSIFGFITLLYVVIALGHYFLNRRNTEKIAQEVAAKQAVETNFIAFKQGINPDLLFESLEAMLVVMKSDPWKAEILADNFSTIYRYILSKKNREVVPLQEELPILEALVALFNQLPYRKVILEIVGGKAAWVVPTSLLLLVERIIRTTIAVENRPLTITIAETPEDITVHYLPEERLQRKLDLDSLADLIRSYRFYSATPIRILENENRTKTIQLPKLNYHESSDP
ncbi:MAG: histidine kinase [Bacteroidota bacterium]